MEWNSCAGSFLCFCFFVYTKKWRFNLWQEMKMIEKRSKCTMTIYPARDEILPQKVSWRYSSKKSHFTCPFSCFSRKKAFFCLFQFCLYFCYRYWRLTLCARTDCFDNKVLFEKAQIIEKWMKKVNFLHFCKTALHYIQTWIYFLKCMCSRCSFYRKLYFFFFYW